MTWWPWKKKPFVVRFAINLEVNEDGQLQVDIVSPVGDQPFTIDPECKVKIWNRERSLSIARFLLKQRDEEAAKYLADRDRNT